MSDRSAHGGHSRAGQLNGTSSAEPPRTDNSGLLLERVPAILYTADAGGDGRWHYVSPQIEGILGFTPEEWCTDPGMWAHGCILTTLGCDLVQGFRFSRPVPAAEITRMLAEGPAWLAAPMR
jgi:PAS domain-containing protein